MNKETLAQLTLVCCAIVWGITFTFSKIVVKELHPLVTVGYRFLLAALVLLPFVWHRRNAFRNAIYPGLLLGLLIWIALVTQTWGLTITTAANSGFITGLFVLFVPIFLFIFKSVHIHKIEALSIILALGGLWLLTGGTSSSFNRGDQLTILCAVASAWHIIFMGQYAKSIQVDKLILTFIQFAIVGILSVIFAVLIKQPLYINTVSVWPPLLFLVFFGTIFTFSSQVWAQKYVSSIKASLIFTLEPIASACFAWTLGGEKFLMMTALGGILILLATLISTLKDFSFKLGSKERLS